MEDRNARVMAHILDEENRIHYGNLGIGAAGLYLKKREMEERAVPKTDAEGLERSKVLYQEGISFVPAIYWEKDKMTYALEFEDKAALELYWRNLKLVQLLADNLFDELWTYRHEYSLIKVSGGRHELVIQGMAPEDASLSSEQLRMRMERALREYERGSFRYMDTSEQTQELSERGSLKDGCSYLIRIDSFCYSNCPKRLFEKIEIKEKKEEEPPSERRLIAKITEMFSEGILDGETVTSGILHEYVNRWMGSRVNDRDAFVRLYLLKKQLLGFSGQPLKRIGGYVFETKIITALKELESLMIPEDIEYINERLSAIGSDGTIGSLYTGPENMAKQMSKITIVTELLNPQDMKKVIGGMEK